VDLDAGRSPALAFGVVGCALLMLRDLVRWVRSLGQKYEHSGLAV